MSAPAKRSMAPSVKRLMKEAQNMAKTYDPTGDIHAAPLGEGDNLFDWHFTIRGPPDSPYSKGIYHGRLIFPPTYPMKPPEIFLLTTSGRFETSTKICLSISGYHPETWLPAWSIQTAVTALQAFFTTKAKGSIGGIEWPSEARESAALKSHNYVCKNCGPICEILNVKSKNSNNNVKETVDNETTDNNINESSNNTADTDVNNNSEKPNSIPEKPQVLKKSPTQIELEEKRRQIEMEMLRNQQDFQQNDLISLLFVILIFGLIGFLGYLRYSKMMVDGDDNSEL